MQSSLFNVSKRTNHQSRGGPIPIEARLDVLQSSLEARFDSRAAVDAGLPTYVFEHGLAPRDLSELISNVREGLLNHRIESAWWALRALPLLVAATEIGYLYEGKGFERGGSV